MPFPVGVQTFTARYTAIDLTGDGTAASSYVTAEIETPLVWAATGTLILPVTTSKWTKAGVADFVLPLPGQSGFTAGFGGSPVTSFGFKFYAQPTKSKPITPGSTTFVNISATPGQVVNIGNLVNIGAWPHATFVVGGSGGTGTFTPVTIGGVSGYWSPS